MARCCSAGRVVWHRAGQLARLLWPWGRGAAAGRVVAVVVLFQLLHWFRPSEPYLVDILEDSFGIAQRTVSLEIFPVSSFAMIPAALVVGCVFEFLGFGSALLLAAVAAVATVALVLASGGALPAIYASQGTFALSFTSVYAVSAALYALLPTRLYQRATSLSRAGALLGTILSSAAGQVMVASLPSAFPTLWGSLSGTVLSLVVLVVAVAGQWLRGVAPRSRRAAECKGGAGVPGVSARGSELSVGDDEGADERREPENEDSSEGDCSSDGEDDDGEDGDDGVAIGGGDDSRDGVSDDDAAASTGLDESSCVVVPVASALSSPRGACSCNAGRAGDALAPQLPPPLSSQRARADSSTDDDMSVVSTHSGSSLWGIAPRLSRAALRARLTAVWASAGLSYKDSDILLLSLWSAAIRAVHTLVLTYWQPLLDGVDPTHGRWNGAISTAAYVASAILVCVPAVMDRAVPWLSLTGVAGGAVVCAVLCVLLSVAPTLGTAAGLFVAFHALAEGTLVVASAHIGRRMVAVAAAHSPGTQSRPAEYLVPGASLELALLPRRVAKGVHFAAVFCTNSLLGLLLQLGLQSALGSTGLGLPLPRQFLVFGAFLIAGVLAAAGLVGQCLPRAAR